MYRNKSLDFAKGIAIILVVIGHCYSFENFVLQWIYGFHMPFFFIVSGMLYAEIWKDGVKFNFHKTAKRLIVPYFVFEMAFALLISILNRSENTVFLFKNYLIKKILTGIGVTVTWYLPCSLIVSVMFAIIRKWVNKKTVQISIILILTVIGVCIPVSGYEIVLWRSFVGLGFLQSDFMVKISLRKKQIYVR